MGDNGRRGVFPEKKFDEIFGAYDSFFREQILIRGFHYLLHATNNHYWVPYLVEEFYDCFEWNNVDIDRGVIYLVWRGLNIKVSLDLISQVTGIPIYLVNLPTKDLGHYLPHMGPNCSIALDGGIRGTTLYENVYTAFRWVQNNIIGVPTFHHSIFLHFTLFT